MLKRTACLILIFLFAEQLCSQERAKCYFDITISNQTYTISDYSIENLVIRSMEQNLSPYVERSYNPKDTIRCVIVVQLMTAKNKWSRKKMGITFSFYGAFRTYPWMATDLMPEDFAMGMTGAGSTEGDLEYIRNSMDEFILGLLEKWYNILKYEMNNEYK